MKYFEENQKFKKNSWRQQFLIYLGVIAIIFSFGAGVVVGEEIVRKRYVVEEERNKLEKNTNLDVVFEAWKKLGEKYVGEMPDSQAMVYGMAKGMTGALKDPYTSFFEPEKAKQFKEDLKGSFEGIGAEIGIKQNILTIVAPIEGSPADKAGLRSGDRIIKIDDLDTTGLELDEAISKIRGKRGTKVKLTVFSEEDKSPKEVEIVRDVIDPKSVKYEQKEDNIAYIRLASFSEDTVKEFTDIARVIKEKNAKKIILDLRGNPGGYLETAVDIAGFFLPEKTLVVREDFGGKRKANEYKTNFPPVLEKYPLVILIDKGSASASEILSGALNEQIGAKLVGEKTFGKGSVQEFFSLSDGSTLKVTVAEWLTPKGKSINKEGISPETEVLLSNDDIKENKDTQLEKALEILKGM